MHTSFGHSNDCVLTRKRIWCVVDVAISFLYYTYDSMRRLFGAETMVRRECVQPREGRGGGRRAEEQVRTHHLFRVLFFLCQISSVVVLPCLVEQLLVVALSRDDYSVRLH